MNRWLKIGFLIMASSLLQSAQLKDALNDLKQNPYGFVMCNVGITPLDLEQFNSIDIQREWVFHQFGELELIQESIVNFIAEIGNNEIELTLQVACRLKDIVKDVINASGKTTGWVCLRSFTPINRFDVPRWHVDGPYYNPDGPEELLFKFVVTLVGSPTLFYPLSLELRRMTQSAIHNKQFMMNFCKKENIISPNIGEGTFFTGGQYNSLTALHSEPPIHEKRLFFFYCSMLLSYNYLHLKQEL